MEPLIIFAAFCRVPQGPYQGNRRECTEEQEADDQEREA